MESIINLRGAIKSKYPRLTDFAAEAGWKYGKATRIANGRQEPDVDDIIKLTEMLGIETPETFMAIFFAPLSTKWTSHTA